MDIAHSPARFRILFLISSESHIPESCSRATSGAILSVKLWDFASNKTLSVPQTVKPEA
jgi:hypothetical protein